MSASILPFSFDSRGQISLRCALELLAPPSTGPQFVLYHHTAFFLQNNSGTTLSDISHSTYAGWEAAPRSQSQSPIKLQILTICPQSSSNSFHYPPRLRLNPQQPCTTRIEACPVRRPPIRDCKSYWNNSELNSRLRADARVNMSTRVSGFGTFPYSWEHSARHCANRYQSRPRSKKWTSFEERSFRLNSRISA